MSSTRHSHLTTAQAIINDRQCRRHLPEPWQYPRPVACDPLLHAKEIPTQPFSLTPLTVMYLSKAIHWYELITRARRAYAHRPVQGAEGQFTHFYPGTLHAIDFECAPGTPVLSLAGGVVKEVRQSNTAGGIHARGLFDWNSVSSARVTSTAYSTE